MKSSIILMLSCFVFSCVHFEPERSAGMSTSALTTNSYGYSPSNPIKVGDGNFQNGALNEKIYLSSLRGPNGETVDFWRRGSCCEFETENGFMGKGLLDEYEVSYTGLKKPKTLYINMYDSGELKAPSGFTLY